MSLERRMRASDGVTRIPRRIPPRATARSPFAPVARLAQAPVLRDLSSQWFATLISTCQEIRLPKGSILFSSGSRPAVYVAMRGRVETVIYSHCGSAVQLGAYRPGDLFGAASLLLGRQAHEARALEPAVVAAFAADTFRAALEANPSALWALAALLAEGSALLESRLIDLALRDVPGRVLDALVGIARTTTVSDRRGRIITDRVTHEELARLVGANRVSVSRALSLLRRRGDIAMCGRHVVVPHGKVTDPAGATDRPDCEPPASRLDSVSRDGRPALRAAAVLKVPRP